MLIQSPLKGKQNMKHTTPPLGPSSLPDTDAEFQKYKDARREGYSIMKALVELKFEAGIQHLSQCEQVIQEHLAMEPIMIAPGVIPSLSPKPLAATVCASPHSRSFGITGTN